MYCGGGAHVCVCENEITVYLNSNKFCEIVHCFFFSSSSSSSIERSVQYVVAKIVEALDRQRRKVVPQNGDISDLFRIAQLLLFSSSRLSNARIESNKRSIEPTYVQYMLCQVWRQKIFQIGVKVVFTEM